VTSLATYVIFAGVPFSVSTTLAIGLTDGGAFTMLYGYTPVLMSLPFPYLGFPINSDSSFAYSWVIVSLICLAIAASLAEICSVFPTAGGVYYWSHMLASPKYAPIASWTTGWLALVGNWTVRTPFPLSLPVTCFFCVLICDEKFKLHLSLCPYCKTKNKKGRSVN